jgi:Family of unknown function (DUF6059)
VRASAAGQQPSGDRRPTLRRALVAAPRAVGRYVLAGLSLLGYSTSAVWPLAVPAPTGPCGAPVELCGAPVELCGALAELCGGPEPALPPGHPERLVPHLAPSPVERRLWAQLRPNEGG